MALVSLKEAKEYLRVDTADEDATICVLLSTAERLCVDIARLSEVTWTAVNSDVEEEALDPIRKTMKVAILYALGYLFEHREEADHHDLVLTLRSLLFALRSVWSDYFKCWATTSDQTGNEDGEGSTTDKEDRMDFTVRYSSETAAVISTKYRILLMDRIYDIDHVDDMGFKRNSRKFHAHLTKR